MNIKWIEITKDPETWPPMKEKVLITYMKEYPLPWGAERVFEIAHRDSITDNDGFPIMTTVVIRDDVQVHWWKLEFKEKK